MIFQIGQSDGRKFWCTNNIPNFDIEEVSNVKIGNFYKIGKTFGQKCLRQYFLIKQYLFYSDVGNFKNVKGYVRLDGVYLQFQRVNQEYQIYLRNNGFQIILCTDIDEQFQEWSQMLSQKCILTTFEKDYKIGSLIGNGTFSTVYECWNHEGELFAVKAITKCQSKQMKNNKQYELQLLSEINALREFNHENILKLHQVYENTEKLYLVTEYIDGYELISKQTSKIPYSSNELQSFVYQMLLAIHQIHSYNMMHRDIKPQNIILKNGQLNNPILIDFGLAVSTQIKDIPFPSCGSLGYSAPEILRFEETKKQYNGQCDIFSFGITLFTILFGYNPFKGYDQKQTIKRNADAYFEIPSSPYPTELCNLILLMTKKYPKDRITALQALTHPYFNIKFYMTIHLPMSILTKQQYEMSKNDKNINVHSSLEMDYQFGLNSQFLNPQNSPKNQKLRTSTINSNPQRKLTIPSLDQIDEFQLDVFEDSIETSHLEKLKMNQNHFYNQKNLFNSIL
ncbi:unnamed protein product [Paramecium sonneborni]|uniref:Protein kinase domain-containing protein n=1 Tax=Paramecium sonneborni TaxID=65129 RepID=A0A8S1MDI8_9CILI|nr:unnamed protein product [Paramecium sonneborni]